MKVNLSSDEVFINSSSSSSYIGTNKVSEMTELRRLKLRDTSPQQINLIDKDLITFIEIPIEKTDTLQGLSLKYGCTISQIKRLNNLAIDRDLFALNTCRIPIKEHSVQSVLYEKELKRIHINDLYWLNNKKLSGNFDNDSFVDLNANSDSDEANGVMNNELNNDKIPLIDSNDSNLPRTSSTTSLSKNSKAQTREAIKFFKNIDKDLETIRASTNQQKKIMLDTTNSSSVLLNDQSSFNQNIKPDNSLCNLKEVTIIGFIVVIVIPAVIYIYMRILHKMV